jgi:hypothetical protein
MNSKKNLAAVNSLAEAQKRSRSSPGEPFEWVNRFPALQTYMLQRKTKGEAFEITFRPVGLDSCSLRMPLRPNGAAHVLQA